MSESVQQDLPITHHDDRIEVTVSAEQGLVVREAAQLMGWTVEQYVLSAVLDRAERDLYEHAAHQREISRARPVPVTGDQPPAAEGDTDLVAPFVAMVTCHRTAS